MLSYQLIDELARLRYREALAASEARRGVSKAIRRIRALDLLRRAVMRGLHSGLGVEDLRTEISLTLKRASSS